MSTGISATDFSQIMQDYERTVSYSVVTKSVSGNGEETSTYASPVNYSVIFFLQENRYIFDKEGLLAVGDCYLMAPISLGIKRYDKFTIDGETYIIQNTIERYVANVHMHTYAVCYKLG